MRNDRETISCRQTSTAFFISTFMVEREMYSKYRPLVLRHPRITDHHHTLPVTYSPCHKATAGIPPRAEVSHMMSHIMLLGPTPREPGHFLNHSRSFIRSLIHSAIIHSPEKVPPN